MSAYTFSISADDAALINIATRMWCEKAGSRPDAIPTAHAGDNVWSEDATAYVQDALADVSVRFVESDACHEMAEVLFNSLESGPFDGVIGLSL